MIIGLTYILREEMIEKCRYVSEFDSIDDIQRLKASIRLAGHEVIDLGHSTTFLSTALKNRVDAVFNYAEGIYGSTREAQIPSVLEMLQIPIHQRMLKVV